MEADFNDMLDGYGLGSEKVSVCRFCLLEDHVTFKRPDMVRYKEELICLDCAKRELNGRFPTGAASPAGMDRLEALLIKTKDLGRIIALLSPTNLPPELTRYDIIPASATR